MARTVQISLGDPANLYPDLRPDRPWSLVGRFGRRDEEGRFARFLCLHAFVAIGTVAFSPVPKYGGVKLFLPFFSSLCDRRRAGLCTATPSADECACEQRFGSAGGRHRISD